MNDFLAPFLKAKYYSLFVLLVVLTYAYFALARIRYTGSDSEKWSPQGFQKHYHK